MQVFHCTFEHEKCLFSPPALCRCQQTGEDRGTTLPKVQTLYLTWSENVASRDCSTAAEMYITKGEGYTVKKANLFSSFHKNLRFWAGKTPFPWREYFSHGPQCVCLMSGPELCSLLWNEKLPEILFIRSVFSSLPGWKNIPSWGAGKRGKLRHEERNQESTFTLQMNQLLQNEFTHEKYNYRQLRLAADEI